MKTSRSLQAQSGIIAVEFVGVLSALLLTILLSIDLSRYFQAQGQLDRLAYSLSTIIAHRNQYYPGSGSTGAQPLTSDQVNTLARIAGNQLPGQQVAINTHRFSRPNGSNTGHQQFASGSGSCPWLNADSFEQLLPGADDPGKDPAPEIYVVELCLTLNSFSLFARFSDADDFNTIYARSLAVAR